MHFCASRQVYLLGLNKYFSQFCSFSWPLATFSVTYGQICMVFGSLIFQSDRFLSRHMQQPIKGVFLFPGKAEIYVPKTYFWWSFKFCPFFLDDVHGQELMSVRNIFFEFQKKWVKRNDLPHNLIFNQPPMFIFSEHMQINYLLINVKMADDNLWAPVEKASTCPYVTNEFYKNFWRTVVSHLWA